MQEHRSGYVGILGPTNSGKSTLLNRLLGKKVSIVSPKVQTTYHRIRGIAQTPESELIWVDTPGFQRRNERMARLLNRVADLGAAEADIAVWVFDVTQSRVLSEVADAAERIRKIKPKDQTILVLNKVDEIQKEKLLPLIGKLAELNIASDIIPLSAKKGQNVDVLAKLVQDRLPLGPQYYGDGQTTDRPNEFVLGEFIREKIYQVTHQELPYSVRIEVEKLEIHTEKVKRVRATIYVDSVSRRKILIGKAGKKMKRIGTEARKEIEAWLGNKVFLELHVQVEADWKKNERRLRTYLELA
jgi:GTP-binding protein Era